MTLSTHLHPVDTQTVTGTIVFGGACSVDETIVIVDAAGTSRTFTAKGSTTAGSLQFINTDATAAATALKLCIDNAAGFGTNSITVADNGSGTLTLTLIVNGTYRFEDKASIVEGLTNVTITKFGSTAGLEDIDGGVVANAGTIPAAGSRFTAKSPLDLNAGSRSSGAKVVANTGTANEIGIAKANTSGTLAYNPSGRDVTRSSSDTGFVIRSGVANKISGVAGLNPILSGGSDINRNAGNLHKKSTHYSQGAWATHIFNLFTGRFMQNDNSIRVQGEQGYGTSNAITWSSPPTRAIPGEFYILQNFVSYVGTSTSGDGSSSENMMDYSAVTGG